MSFEFQIEGKKTIFRTQKGAKPIRTLSRFLKYCKDLPEINEIMKLFESFRIKHSLILNDKIIKGTLAFSIHPLDFMTMSDNDSDWQSCMAWTDDGCYHEGTIEMMNSNNVICCYLENSKPYYFGKDSLDKDNPDYFWNNKRWRQLVYFTKDIIVSGKPYPYFNDPLSIKIVNTLRDLARKNLNWNYSFGPEQYMDMVGINSSYKMDHARTYGLNGHKILFDTQGMYNDMLNDSNTTYWCVRNKVKHSKIISYSGKGNCLGCNKIIINPIFDDDDYNERFENVGQVICEDCMRELSCEVCSDWSPTKKLTTVVTEEGKIIKVCSSCAKKFIKKCPDCGKPFFLTCNVGYDVGGDYFNKVAKRPRHYPAEFICIDKRNYIDEQEFNNRVTFVNDESMPPYTKEEAEKTNNCYYTTIYPIMRCHKCAEKDNNFEKIVRQVGGLWGRHDEEFRLSKEVCNKEDWKKYLPTELENIEIKEGDIILG